MEMIFFNSWTIPMSEKTLKRKKRNLINSKHFSMEKNKTQTKLGQDQKHHPKNTELEARALAIRVEQATSD